jgi:hypothetical protein
LRISLAGRCVGRRGGSIIERWQGSLQ